MAEQKLLTVGEIARELGQPIHRIEYVVREYRIKPEGRAGRVRVFGEVEMKVIANLIRKIDQKKQGGER